MRICGRTRSGWPSHRPPTTGDHHDAIGQACGCTACGGRLRLIGQDVSELLEYVPAHFKVIRHVRPKLACVACEAIFQAAAPSRPIARGIAGPGLLAHVMVSKYCDHIPLYRQSGIYARDGVAIDRSTMAGWVEHGDELLDPLVAALGRYALAGAKVHADDTPVAVLDPGRGRTKTGRLWVYVRDDRAAGSNEAPAVWFRYSPDRKGEHPQKHLESFSGILQADAYGGWGKLYDSGRVTEAACWAHARRPWWELHLSLGRAHGTVAEQALKRIAALYAVEADIRGQPPDERRRQRQARAGPLLQELHAWLSSMVGRVSAKSEIAGAIGYTLSRWQALTRYRDDGRIEIDNNAAERALRGVSLGRKNYLFMGSDAGGERAAAIYSLVETAKLNGLDPEAYLREVLTRIADHPSTASTSCCRGTSAGTTRNNDRRPEHGDQGTADQDTSVDPATAHRAARHQAQGLAPGAGARDDHAGQAAHGHPGCLRLGHSHLHEFIAGDGERDLPPSAVPAIRKGSWVEG
jgi:transposase